MGAALRPRQGGTHQLLSAAPVQDVHVLRDVANAFLHLLQHGCRGASPRRTSRVSTLFQGVLNAVLYFLQCQYCPWNERHWCSPVTRWVRRLAVGSDCRERQPIPLGDRTPCWIFRLDSNGAGGNGAKLVTFCNTELNRLSSEPVNLTRLLSVWNDPLPLLLFFSVYLSSKPHGRSVGRMRAEVQRRCTALNAVAPGCCHAARLGEVGRF